MYFAPRFLPYIYQNPYSMITYGYEKENFSILHYPAKPAPSHSIRPPLLLVVTLLEPLIRPLNISRVATAISAPSFLLPRAALHDMLLCLVSHSIASAAHHSRAPPEESLESEPYPHRFVFGVSSTPAPPAMAPLSVPCSKCNTSEALETGRNCSSRPATNSIPACPARRLDGGARALSRMLIGLTDWAQGGPSNCQ